MAVSGVANIHALGMLLDFRLRLVIFYASAQHPVCMDDAITV